MNTYEKRVAIQAIIFTVLFIVNFIVMMLG